MKRWRAPVLQTAVSRIQSMILAGDLTSGQRLPPERVLAGQLSVSRASLREALSVLETMGFVRVEPHRGTFVAAAESADGATTGTPAPGLIWRYASRYSLREVYQFRLLVEGYAARLATMAATEEQTADLQKMLQKHKDATRKLDLVISSQMDFELHHRIMVLSHNRIFGDLHENYRAVFLESQRVPMARRARNWETVDEHEKIVQAIEMHDPDGAEYYMRQHIIRAADRVGIALSNTPAIIQKAAGSGSRSE